MKKNLVLVALWSAVFIVPLAAIWLGGILVRAATNNEVVFIRQQGGVALQSVLVAAPFFLMALIATFDLRDNDSPNLRLAYLVALGVGTALSLLIFGIYYYDGYLLWRAGGTGTPATWLNMLLVVSPLISGGGMALSYWLVRRSTSP
jgi:hypothetical protein